MRNRTFSYCLAFLALLFLGAAPEAYAEREQPRMQVALALLEQAKESDKPAPLLREAKKHLFRARGNKGGRRVDAVKAIDAALELIEKDKDPKSKIQHAITMVKAAIDNGEN